MPQTNSFISTNITIDDVSRALKDIASNQQLDDDIQTRRYEMMERFGSRHVKPTHNEKALSTGLRAVSFLFGETDGERWLCRREEITP